MRHKVVRMYRSLFLVLVQKLGSENGFEAVVCQTKFTARKLSVAQGRTRSAGLSEVQEKDSLKFLTQGIDEQNDFFGGGHRRQWVDADAWFVAVHLKMLLHG